MSDSSSSSSSDSEIEQAYSASAPLLVQKEASIEVVDSDDDNAPLLARQDSVQVVEDGAEEDRLVEVVEEVEEVEEVEVVDANANANANANAAAEEAKGKGIEMTVVRGDRVEVVELPPASAAAAAAEGNVGGNAEESDSASATDSYSGSDPDTNDDSKAASDSSGSSEEDDEEDDESDSDVSEAHANIFLNVKKRGKKKEPKKEGKSEKQVAIADAKELEKYDSYFDRLAASNDGNVEAEMQSFQFDTILRPDDRKEAENLPEILRIRHELETDEQSMGVLQEEFEREKGDREVLLGSIMLDEIKLHERSIEATRAKALRHNAVLIKTEMEILRRMDKTAAREVDAYYVKEHKGLRQRITQHTRDVAGAEKEREKAYEQAQKLLTEVVQQEEEEIKAHFGSLDEGGIRSRRTKLRWEKAPRLMVVHIDWLRAVKDKVPGGNYLVMVTVYDRLGGNPLRWASVSAEHRHSGFTLHPRKHGGKHYNLEINFAQKGDNRIFLSCPAEEHTRPGMCLVFELFAVRTQFSAYDKVVAWGVFPMCDSSKRLVQGKFKTPLLRGCMTPSVDKYSKIQDMMLRNLDVWLCNLYVTISPWSRKLNGQDEFTSEMEFSNRLLRLADRPLFAMNRDGNYIDEEGADDGAIAGDHGEYSTIASQSGLYNQIEEEFGLAREGALRAFEDELGEGEVKEVTLNVSDAQREPSKIERAIAELSHVGRPSQMGPHRGPVSRVGRASLATRMGAGVASGVEMSRNTRSQLSTGIKGKGGDEISSLTGGFLRRLQQEKALAGDDAPQAAGSAFMAPSGGGMMGAITEGNEEDEEDLVLDDDDVDPEELERRIEAKQREMAEKKSQVLRQYQHSLGNIDVDVPAHPLNEKLFYIIGEIMSDYSGVSSPSRWKTLDFWIAFLLLAAAVWVRMLVHYLGQYLYLISIGVHVFEFTPYFSYVSLLYSNETVPLLTQTFVVLWGPLSNIILFVFLCLCTKGVQAMLGTFPDTLSRFLLALGLNTVLDPFLIALVDALRENSDGDMFKLFNKFGTIGVGEFWGGVVLTFALYVMMLIMSLLAFYTYLNFLHMNGRMLDVYYRLNGDESKFFLPHDMEISLRVLRYILARAKRFKGFHGGTRQVTVTRYTVRDHVDPDFVDETMHLSLYNVEKGSSELEMLEGRFLHRHFIRKSDGTILELIESEFSAEVDHYAEMEGKLLTKKSTMEDLERKQLHEMKQRLDVLKDKMERVNKEDEKNLEANESAVKSKRVKRRERREERKKKRVSMKSKRRLDVQGEFLEEEKSIKEDEGKEEEEKRGSLQPLQEGDDEKYPLNNPI